jgi:CPA2 family monovalent cation:H+ antiporter-2
VANLVPVAGSALLGCYGLALSWALLPSLSVLAVLLVTVAIVTWLLWRSFIRVYAKAQTALQETLAQAPAPHPHAEPAPPTPLPALIREANLETVTIASGSAAAGKLIRELELRSQTGASIVGIGRGGTSVINPGPDEELQVGDDVLLLGSGNQLAQARQALARRDNNG